MGIFSSVAAESASQEKTRADRSTPSVSADDYFGNLSLVPSGLPGSNAKGQKGKAVDGVWFGHSERVGSVKAKARGGKGIRDAKMPKITDTRTTQPKLVPIQDALDRPWAWNKAKWDQEMKRASLAAGRPVTSRDEFLQIWTKAVQWANAAQRAGKPLTPYNAMDLMARDAAAVSMVGNKPVTSVATSVDEITEGTAWNILDSAVRNALGRAPTNAELHRFISQAKTIASRSPHVTTTTTTQKADGSSSSKQTSKGGADQGDYLLAAQNLAATPEAAAVQAATTYMGALMSAVNSPVNLTSPGGR